MGRPNECFDRRARRRGLDVIGPAELSRLALAGGVTEKAQEKDYVLAWLLAARAAVGPASLVFKGGTALRRCYFQGYRYSEDLDFTSEQPIDRAGLVEILGRWCEWLDDRVGIKAQLVSDRRDGEHTAYLGFVGPLRAADGRSLKVDVATNETEREASVKLGILSEFSDLDGDAYRVDVYSLVEIWAEKARSLMQRSQPRDLYDLDHVLAEDRTLPRAALDLFGRKTRAIELDPTVLLERLEERKKKFEALWESSLTSQVAELGAFDGVWRRVMRGLRDAGY